MSGCFNVGLAFGDDIHFGTFTPDMFKTLPATFLVTVGGFITNAIYCFYQNTKNHTWSDYKNEEVWGNNILYCALAGALWYSQFFGLSLGKGFLTESPTYDSVFLHPDGTQRGVLKCMGHHPEGMEGLLKEDHRRINRRHHRLDHLKFLATTYITKKRTPSISQCSGAFH